MALWKNRKLKSTSRKTSKNTSSLTPENVGMVADPTVPMPVVEESKPATERRKKIAGIPSLIMKDTKLDNSPHLKNLLNNPNADNLQNEMKGTKVGAILGVAVLPLAPVMIPLYVWFRSKGQDKDQAMTNAFQMTWKFMIPVAFFAPIPGGRWIAAGMLALYKPVEKWTEQDVETFKVLGKKIKDDPKLQADMVELGTNAAMNIAVRGDDMNEKDFEKMLKGSSKAISDATTRQALETGQLTQGELKDIKKIAGDIDKNVIKRSANFDDDDFDFDE